MCSLVLRHYGPDILGAPARTAQMTADSYRNRRPAPGSVTINPQAQTYCVEGVIATIEIPCKDAASF
jgi:hypothetical protein